MFQVVIHLVDLESCHVGNATANELPILHWLCWQGTGSKADPALSYSMAFLLSISGAVPGGQLSVLKK